jgi:tetratricopeptide (TPR) repeat protein
VRAAADRSQKSGLCLGSKSLAVFATFILISGCSSTKPVAPAPVAVSQARLQADNAAKLTGAGNWTAAARAWQQTAEGYALLNDRANEAIAWHNLAQAQRELGQTAEARTRLEQAAALNLELGRTNEWWRNQIALLQIERQDQESAAAEKRLARLTPLANALSAPELRGLFLNELGLWQMRQHEMVPAEATFRQAEQAFLKANHAPGLAAVLANRAQLALAQARPLEALALWRSALTRYESLADARGIAFCLAGLGRAQLAAGTALDQAESNLRRAADNYRRLNLKPERIATLQVLVECLDREKNTAAADPVREKLKSLKASDPARKE